jgi:RecG-like helicase
MSDEPIDSDVEWEYLSNVIQGSNNDDDLIDDEEVKDTPKAPKTHLEAQIQNLASPNVSLSKISNLRPGKVHLHGQFSQVMGRYLRAGLHLTEAIFSDSTGSVRVVWFNQPYKAAAIKHGAEYELRGNYNLYRGRFQISNSKIRPLSQGCKPFERGERG